MLRHTKFALGNVKRFLRTHSHKHSARDQVPEHADVVIIGTASIQFCFRSVKPNCVVKVVEVLDAMLCTIWRSAA